MMTRKLWWALRHPPATHPIFQRTVLLPLSHKRRYLSWAGVTITLVLGLSDFMPTILILVIPLLLLLSGILYGMECAVRVGHAIASEHENGTYTLLALCPQGGLAASWVICTSALYRNRDFERLYDIVQSSVNIALIGLGILSAIILLVSTAAAAPFNEGVLTLTLMVNSGVIFVVMYWEFIQSVLIGCLIGLLIPTYGASGLDASLYAPGIFLLLKIGLYALTVLVGMNIIPEIYMGLQLEGQAADISLTLLRAFLFIGLQEGAIYGLWRYLLKRINTDDAAAWAFYLPSKGS